MAEHKAAPKAKPKPKRKTTVPLAIRVVRACGFQHIKALEHLFTTIFGNGLSLFKPEYREWGRPDLVVRRNPLRLVHEVVQYHSPQAFSAHIEPDLETCALPPTLILSLDEGSSGFCALWFLCFVTGLRFFGVRDPCHREWNDTRNTLGDQNLWWVVLITTMAFGLPHGPWESAKFWNVIVGAAVAYVARASWSSLFFFVLCEHTCHDMGCVPTGTQEHMRQISENILVSESPQRKATTLQQSGGSHGSTLEDAGKSFHSRILSYIMFGLRQGIYKDFIEVPLWRVEGEDGGLIFSGGDDEGEEENREEAAAAEGDVEGAGNAQIQADEKKQAIRENDDLKALRTKRKNSVHAIAYSVRAWEECARLSESGKRKAIRCGSSKLQSICDIGTGVCQAARCQCLGLHGFQNGFRIWLT